MLDALEPRRQFTATGLDPTYGTAGVARIAVAEGGSTKALSTQTNAAAFATSGAGYVQVREQYPAQGGLEQDYQDRYLVYRVNADGTFDQNFGTAGRFQTKAPGDIVFFQTFAVSPSGRLVVSDSEDQYHVFDAAGHEQYGVSNRLTRTINRLRDTPYSYSTPKVQFSEKVAFDREGRLLIAGEYTDSGRENALAVFRFTTYGLLDHSFGNVGRAFTGLSYDDINYATTQLAVGRDGQIVFTVDKFSDATPPAGATTYYSGADLYQATFSPDGTRLASARFAASPNPVSTEPTEGTGNLDLRPMGDGTLDALTYTDTLNQITAISPDGTFASTPIGGDLLTPIRLAPAGTLRGWVGPTKHDPYRPLEGSTDDFVKSDPNSSNGYAVLGDGSLIAAGTDRTAATPTLIVEKFDGTDLASPADPANPAVTTLQMATRTLDVRGTIGDDEIHIDEDDNGLLRVSVNGAVSEFKFSDFDTLHVSGDNGDDTIVVTVGRRNLAVRIRGDAGDDELKTDAYQATIDGGIGDDTARLTPGSDLNPIGIETLRHPDRHS